MRIEKDSMGEMHLPDEALYGASTQRAVLNFPISDKRFQREFISALGFIKLAAATVNRDLGLLAPDKAAAIIAAAEEVVTGKNYQHFVVDVYQTGSGTSTNMNANEVIANRALEILQKPKGDKKTIHPNDDVNLCQSSNDVFPSAIHIAAVELSDGKLIPALKNLHAALIKKTQEFSAIVKVGRTHLQDATPITLGQEFSGYAAQVQQAWERIERALISVRHLPLGGTAVGTGLNAHPEFASKVIAFLNERTGRSFSEAENHFAAQAAQDSILELSGALKGAASALIKIANDIRWLAAGPRCNLAELKLPEIQPGSSIMPGKVNPVICESVIMVACQVIGYDTAITFANQQSNFELNTALPVMAYSILESINLLAAAGDNFAEKCIAGISANEDRCKFFAEASLSNCTALVPTLGYDAAAQVAKKAVTENLSIKEAALAAGLTTPEDLDILIDIVKMTKGGIV
ncbi:MAG: class II fumarate hydratase [Bdellovibrionota bacterium]|jgi:fumarate hydratase class II